MRIAALVIDIVEERLPAIWRGRAWSRRPEQAGKVGRSLGQSSATCQHA